MILLSILAAIFAAFAIHEGGHFVAAFLFGKRLRFRFAWGWLWKIPVPRGVWEMPEMERWKQRVVALAGFGTELLSVLTLSTMGADFVHVYVCVATAHFVAYLYYAGEANDFKWL